MRQSIKSLASRRLIETSATIPVIPFLCPALLVYSPSITSKARRVKQTAHPQAYGRHLHTQTTEPSVSLSPEKASTPVVRALPTTCPGCGAFSQSVEPNEAGYYTRTRGAVKAFLGLTRGDQEAASAAPVLAQLDEQTRQKYGLDSLLSSQKPRTVEDSIAEWPMCDRCHKLEHHSQGNPISHPSIEAIQETIAQSPHSYNHVYHILDAADFPMSLIPKLQENLSLAPQRSQNRRAKSTRYHRGRAAEMSFIVTRSDLLAPTKKQVDSLMPYLVEVLRDALKYDGIRLGNVKCVSAKKSWWTKELKEHIWEKGGAGWMVGKVNVGKSRIFQEVYPKGRNMIDRDPKGDILPIPLSEQSVTSDSHKGIANDEKAAVAGEFDNFLLPPAQPETAYPVMPLISALPGTTASPIRVPYGRGKGELIDLPGLSRGELENYVREECRSQLVMDDRIRPIQQVIKSGDSLLLGGLIRITPTTPDVTILAYSFLNFDSHRTSTEKAIGTQTQERESGIETIAMPGIGQQIKSAGTFELKWDVTKRQAGPLTASHAVGLSAKVLPFAVLSTDILIEGCGWVELVAQVRNRNRAQSINVAVDSNEPSSPNAYPSIEVFSPEGRFISSRRPMGAWMLGVGNKQKSKSAPRQRRSMKGAKKWAKMAS